MESSETKDENDHGYIRIICGFLVTLVMVLLGSAFCLESRRFEEEFVYLATKFDVQRYEIRIDLRTDRKRGTEIFSEGLHQAIKTYKGKCKFVPSNVEYNDIIKNDRAHRFFFVLSGTNLCSVLRSLSGKFSNKARNTIFGTRPVPSNWKLFPQKNCMEKNFSYTLSLMGSYAVHSPRVEKWLASRSGLKDYPTYKFANVRACTMMQPGDIIPWPNRSIDVILFEKYADYDHRKQGEELYSELKKAGLKVTRIGANGDNHTKGHYTHKQLEDIAKNAKFIIYFSFWDTGAIALLEVQSFGVYSFTVQNDLIDKGGKTGMYVASLADKNMTKSAEIILERMRKINAENPRSEEFARVNQERNHCHRALDDICKHVVHMPTWKDP